MTDSLIDQPALEASPASHAAVAELSLSALLRTHTAPLHRQVEVLLGLPDAIGNGSDYRHLLGHFLGLYEPLERNMAAFPGWGALGLAAPSRSHTRSLTRDLLALGIDPANLPRAPTALLPKLPSLAQALGACYVLEGATLGGRVILRDLQARLGSEIADATSFFGGRGDSVGPTWQEFRAVLDRFGQQHEAQLVHVVAGAERTFQAMLDWFAACPAYKAAAP